jgi:hypothetical protein
MNNPLVLFVALSTLVAFDPTHGLAADVSVTVPRTAQAAPSAVTLSRARDAILRFATACLNHDQSRLARAVTDDFIVEYALPQPGVYLSVDATAPDGYCGAHVPTTSVEQISNLWIFPTNESNAVFVRYNTDSKSDSFSNAVSTEHLALVELRGDRIAKIRDFTTSTDDIVKIATGSARNPTHVSFARAKGGIRGVSKRSD